MSIIKSPPLIPHVSETTYCMGHTSLPVLSSDFVGLAVGCRHRKDRIIGWHALDPRDTNRETERDSRWPQQRRRVTPPQHCLLDVLQEELKQLQSGQWNIWRHNCNYRLGYFLSYLSWSHTPISSLYSLDCDSRAKPLSHHSLESSVGLSTQWKPKDSLLCTMGLESHYYFQFLKLELDLEVRSFGSSQLIFGFLVIGNAWCKNLLRGEDGKLTMSMLLPPSSILCLTLWSLSERFLGWCWCWSYWGNLCCDTHGEYQDYYHREASWALLWNETYLEGVRNWWIL